MNQFIGIIVLLVLVVSTLLSPSCTSASFRERADSLFLITDQVDIYYDLKQPEEKYYLPYILSEVSGITFQGKDTIWCVEDEGGRAYAFSLIEKDIVHAIKFSDPGDFEGIELIGDRLYALESDGDIYDFQLTKEREAKAKKYENKLSRDNDTEGLGMHSNGNLLVACKEEEDIKGVNAKGKTVYQFDLKKKKLIEEPFFEITASMMDDFFEANRKYKYDKDRIKFEPSGIAFNPHDGYYYLMASVGKMLIVIDEQSRIKATYPIAPRILSQPEGIAFAPNGDLYISSEGEGDRGYLIRFKMKSK